MCDYVCARMLLAIQNACLFECLLNFIIYMGAGMLLGNKICMCVGTLLEYLNCRCVLMLFYNKICMGRVCWTSKPNLSSTTKCDQIHNYHRYRFGHTHSCFCSTNQPQGPWAVYLNYMSMAWLNLAILNIFGIFEKKLIRSSVSSFGWDGSP